MTLPEMSGATSGACAKKPTDLGEAVKQFLIRAQEDMRIIYGVYACAKFLESSPSDVGICILPQMVPDEDPLIQITRTLMEAHCAEHCVPVLKVDSSEKLYSIMTSQVSGGSSTQKMADFACLLVQLPTDACSTDEVVLSFCDSMLCDDNYSHHLLELPV